MISLIQKSNSETYLREFAEKFLPYVYLLDVYAFVINLAFLFVVVKYYLRLTCRLQSRSFHLAMSLAILLSLFTQLWVMISSTRFLTQVAQPGQLSNAGFFDRYQIGLALY